MDVFINALLRPYRSVYSLNDLGMKKTDQYIRKEGSVRNDRDLLIQYSYFQNRVPSSVCVVYCHCNSGSRLEGMEYLSEFISKGWNVCLFDFSGSGQSEGVSISLGHFQLRDLDVILGKMRGLGNKQFLLWGRSMGAATIILYLGQAKFRDDICGCVLDSPYSSLWNLVKQLGVQRSILPGFIIEHVMDYVRDRIKKEYGFDIKDLQPVKFIGKIDTPLLFITSVMDEFVSSENVVELYKNSGSRNKRLEYIDKAHNSNRDREIIQLASIFLEKNLQQKIKRQKQRKPLIQKCGPWMGGKTAEIIVRAEIEKSTLKRMKSELQLQRANKENVDRNIQTKKEESKSKLADCKLKEHFKTEIAANSSMLSDLEEKKWSKLNRTFLDRRKAINYSLAHMQYNKKLKKLRKKDIDNQ